MASVPKMLETWRIVKKKYAETAFSGDGSKMYEGRWHHAGIPVVYTAASLSLAALETFIHLEQNMTIEFVALHTKIPNTISFETINESDLPKNWNASPAIILTKNLGTNWFNQNHSAILKVPSVLIPGEYNYLLNPLHKDFSKIQRSKPIPFSFDHRMWKKH
ncbi:MAG: RES family NAD+ phosphorylase [Gammaproteobacteria bacterium]